MEDKPIGRASRIAARAQARAGVGRPVVPSLVPPPIVAEARAAGFDTAADMLAARLKRVTDYVDMRENETGELLTQYHDRLRTLEERSKAAETEIATLSARVLELETAGDKKKKS